MHQEYIEKLFKSFTGNNVEIITPLAKSGSDRIYYRISAKGQSLLGVYNKDARENLAFIEFSRHFKRHELNVPEILAEDISNNVYLIEDLGDATLFSYLTREKKDGKFNDKLTDVYKRVVEDLPKFQIGAGSDFDYSICYPRSDFDKQSMMWDLNYFKYYFLKLAGINFDEQALEDDFKKFVNFLLGAERKYFMYRDFQSRNIMIKNNELYYIDYQGGRRGALQYDLASLLFDAKADIPNHDREMLLNHYVKNLRSYIDFDEKEFVTYYYGFVIIRILQAMGAYGFRGFYEKKAHFLASIPYAMDNLKYVLGLANLPLNLDTLLPVLNKVVNSQKLRDLGSNISKLTVNINSFSYKRGIPVDESGHGGGFVFDCRALPNPGRYDDYKMMTGKDLKVIGFLEKEEPVNEFFDNVTAMIRQSIDIYLQRNFENLTVNFGCTGGQHRSVYFAERLSRWIKDKYTVKVVLRHREQEMK